MFEFHIVVFQIMKPATDIIQVVKVDCTTRFLKCLRRTKCCLLLLYRIIVGVQIDINQILSMATETVFRFPHLVSIRSKIKMDSLVIHFLQAHEVDVSEYVTEYNPPDVWYRCYNNFLLQVLDCNSKLKQNVCGYIDINILVKPNL